MARVKKKSLQDYRHGNLKGALLEAAIDAVAKTGEVNFSLRDLAKRVGVTHAAAYRHFASKKDILFALAEQGHHLLGESFKRILEKNKEDIEGLGIAYVQFAVENPSHFKIMFHPDVKAIEQNASVNPIGWQTFRHLVTCVEANQESRRFTEQDAHLVAMSAWAGVHGLATLVVNDGLASKMKINSLTMTKIMTGHLLHGFLKRS